jgi:hypothetical protein
VQIVGPQVQHLKILLQQFLSKCAKDPSENDMALYIASYISFGGGNASRVDLVDNLTLSEYLGWKLQFFATKVESDPPNLRVS